MAWSAPCGLLCASGDGNLSCPQAALLLELTAAAFVCSCKRRLGSKKVKLISGKLSDSRVMLVRLQLTDALLDDVRHDCDRRINISPPCL